MSGGRVALADAAAANAWGRRLAAVLRPGDVVTLAGTLGAGKTTLARGILAGLGLEGEAPSPSFALVIAYEPPETRLPVWHVDLYRLEQAAELDELGLADAGDGAALLIEWPERMGGLFDADALRLALEPLAGGGRRLTWEAPAAWTGRWPSRP